MNWLKIGVLAVVAIVIVASIVALEQLGSGSGTKTANVSAVPTTNVAKAQKYEAAKALVSPSGFINTSGITIEELVGKKVILVDFWTYSCINCQRTMPYLNGWYEKYRDAGLEIIGVHTPEFEFEKKYENVKRAVEGFGIQYPVVLDNDYGTWRNYANRYWPRKYLIDIDGYIVYDHIGEGAYEETERIIKQLLEERSQKLGAASSLDDTIVSPEDSEKVDRSLRYSPEVYFGASRNDFLANGQKGKTGRQLFSDLQSISLNELNLAGEWEINPEYAENLSQGAKIIFRYQAKKVFMVAAAEVPIAVEVYQDGQKLGTVEGTDVENGEVRIGPEQLYRLINNEAHGEHILELRILGDGLQAFTFTFG